METAELIATLAADAGRTRPLWRDLALAALAALAGGAVIALGLWGPRPDLPHAFATFAFWMKAGYTLGLGAAGLVLVDRLARPGGRSPIGMALVGAAALVVAALALRELAGLPRAVWMPDLKGHTWTVCSWRIAIASAPGFAAALWVLRGAAATRPALAGAAAGLMAGGLGATAYGLHCDETAAVFLSVWYTAGILIWAVVGAVMAPRLLRW